MTPAFVLILAIAMPSYDGGVGLKYVPFETRAACEDAARQWNETAVFPGNSYGGGGRGKVIARCHATGATR